MKNILLIGNSKNVMDKEFVKKTSILFDHVCRFNHIWAHIYDSVKFYRGDWFDTLITSNFAHDLSISELHKSHLLDKVKKIFLICPNSKHRTKINKINKEYEEITDDEYNTIQLILHKYGFPINRKIARTGITSIIFFSFIKKYNVFIYGMDVHGTDNPLDQHIEKNHKVDMNMHSIDEESKLLQKLLQDNHITLYDNI